MADNIQLPELTDEQLEAILTQQPDRLKKIERSLSQKRNEGKFKDGWRYKEALEYLCANVLEMKLSDIFTSSAVRCRLADGSYWYGTGKWPLEMSTRVDALMSADHTLKLSDARAKVKHEFNPDKPPARDVQPAERLAARKKKDEEVKALAAELAADFANYFEESLPAEAAPVEPPPVNAGFAAAAAARNRRRAH